MRLRPLNDTLIVKLDEDQWKEITPDIIKIPDAYEGAYKKKATSGKIVSWGNKCFYSHKEGQRVFFSAVDHRPGFIMPDGDYRFLVEHEILAKDEDCGS